jgi:transposase-like protein
MKVDKKVSKRRRAENVTALVCPDCGGTNVVYEGGYILGQKYHCVDCHYRGTFILERKVVMEEDENVKEI